MGEGTPWRELRALLDPKAAPALRRRGLWLYAAFLLFLHGAFLLLLGLVLPPAAHPALLALALAGAGWLFHLARGALREEGPLAPLVAVGLGAGLVFFLGVMGLLLRPLGLLLLPLGALGFAHLLLRAEKALSASGPRPGP
ncbi:MAG: hypothetical protein NZ846_03890 [Thermus sp.]|uniref:hypothetical protein n=1 Tax=Thermus sp. TaxID=275 RepID=UPI0025F91AA7|nr:hypothetical protein [Thermus sp.]MCS6867360.1 hypothetical protein [Thermus sp.]MCS7218104.1 hypothetical protein [Thermus sp.]MCX7849868.1 hypothetical protein [Thermus sp.]MDW8017752.1 hypothetical protein [Thermus sp.]MDW8357688.1 hypothetical protein [Thermus sp.]